MEFEQEDFDRLAGLGRADFEVRVGERLAVASAPGLTLQLLAVEEPSPLGRVTEGTREGFSLLLAGPAAPVLAQGMHPVELPGAGRLPLFLVPLQTVEGEARYQAVFG